MSVVPPSLPDGVEAMRERGPDWAAWVDRLPRTLSGLLGEWELTPAGSPMHGVTALVVPVSDGHGRELVLKLAFQDRESDHEHLALTHWHGRGAVRLERADPRRGALLLERLTDESLRETWDLQACEVVAGLYSNLHVRAFRPLRSLSDWAAEQGAALRRLPRETRLPRRMVEQAAVLAERFADDRDTDGTLVHGDLHYDNVLRRADGSWAAIDPKPMSGDPHFEPAGLLWNRFEELTGPLGTGVRDGVRRRFHTLVDAAGLDEDRARDWVIVQMVVNAMSALADDAGRPDRAGAARASEEWLTTCISVAKAVQQ